MIVFSLDGVWSDQLHTCILLASARADALPLLPQFILNKQERDRQTNKYTHTWTQTNIDRHTDRERETEI